MGVLAGLTRPDSPDARRLWLILGARAANQRPSVRAAARLALGGHAWKLDSACASCPLPAESVPDPAFTGHILLLDDMVGAKELSEAVQSGVVIPDVRDPNGYRPGDILVAAVCGAVRLERYQFHLWKLSEANKQGCCVFDDDVLSRATRERQSAILSALRDGYQSINPARRSGRYNLNNIS